MTAQYFVSPAALDDIDEIAAWIRRDDPESDRDLRFIEKIYEAFDLIAERPGIGHARPDLTAKPVRFKSFMDAFAIIYRADSNVEIVHVRRWRQDLVHLLREDR